MLIVHVWPEIVHLGTLSNEVAYCAGLCALDRVDQHPVLFSDAERTDRAFRSLFKYQDKLQKELSGVSPSTGRTG